MIKMPEHDNTRKYIHHTRDENFVGVNVVFTVAIVLSKIKNSQKLF